MTKGELKKELHLIPYSGLEKEFKKRNIEEVWKEGELKETLIENAAVRLMDIDKSILLEQPVKVDIDINELRTILEKTDYHNLKKKFDEYGIVGTLRGSQKKKDLIVSAIRRYNEVKILLKQGLNPIMSKGELILIVEENDLKRISDNEELQKQSEINRKAQEKRDEEKIIKIQMTKEQIEHNLRTIDKNLKGSSPAAQIILLRKKQTLTELLVEVNKKPHPFKKLADGTLAIDMWRLENPDKE